MLVQNNVNVKISDDDLTAPRSFMKLHKILIIPIQLFKCVLCYIITIFTFYVMGNNIFVTLGMYIAKFNTSVLRIWKYQFYMYIKCTDKDVALVYTIMHGFYYFLRGGWGLVSYKWNTQKHVTNTLEILFWSTWGFGFWWRG